MVHQKYSAKTGVAGKPLIDSPGHVYQSQLRSTFYHGTDNFTWHTTTVHNWYYYRRLTPERLKPMQSEAL